MTTKNASTNRLQNLTLTIYPGYALVQGQYPVRLNEGRNRFQIEGLPTQYDPGSLYFDQFLGTGDITVGPSSYLAANLTPQALLQRAVNKKVTVRYGGTTEAEQKEVSGTLVGVAGNTALLKVGRKVREIRNVVGYEYEGVPKGLSNTPSLSVTVDATAPGDYVATLLYKALGFNWNADYKLIYNEEKGTVGWEGSVFVNNGSGAAFPDSAIRVVAGDAGEEPQNDGMRPMAASFSLESAPMGGAAPRRASKSIRQATSESLGQIKLFAIPVRGDIAEGDSQKIPFFAAAEVPVKRENRVRVGYNWHWNARAEADVRTVLLFTNDEANKLGKPLPNGSVSVMQRDAAGVLLKSGGAYMGDVAVGEEAKLETGSDFDLKAVRLVKDSQKSEERIALPEPQPAVNDTDDEVSAGPRMSMSIAPQAKKLRTIRKRITTTKQCAVELFNGKTFPVEFVVEEITSDELSFKGSHGFTQTAAGQHEQRVTLAAGQKTTLEYTLVHTQEVDEQVAQ